MIKLRKMLHWISDIVKKAKIFHEDELPTALKKSELASVQPEFVTLLAYVAQMKATQAKMKAAQTTIIATQFEIKKNLEDMLIQ